MGVAQVGDGEFGVVLEGVEGLVADQYLDVIHVGPGTQQFRRTRAPEGVRGDVDGDAGGLGVTMDQPEEHVIREPFAPASTNTAASPPSRSKNGRTALR